MLKKFKSTDIDALMDIWKKEYISTKKKIDSTELTKKYTKVKELFLDKNSNTILYTEDDIIEGFITIDENNQIALIFVNKKIRREGIGSMLVESCKKKYNELYVNFESENEYYVNFFQKNGFEKIECDEKKSFKYQWKNCKEKKVRLIYFDNDLNEKLINNDSKISVKRVNVKEVLKQDKDLKNVKNYINIRKSIENAFDKKVLLYLNCGNYNEVLDDIIKEIAKIEKTEFAIVVSEPLIIENSKMETHLKKIEQSFKDYKIHIINTMYNIKKDISVNKILDEKMIVIIRQIEKIAENM